MENCLIGRVVVSLSGHDAGKAFLVIKEDEPFVYLCDGKVRTLEKPKKKKRKHVSVCEGHTDEVLISKLINREKVYDHDIIRALKVANK